jgi:hypothetical protein
MKIQGSVLLAVAMMVGSAGAVGCKSQDKITDTGNAPAAADELTTDTPEDNPEAAAVAPDGADEATAGVEKDARGFAHWAGHAPPAARFEHAGAGRAGHFWRPGYYGWAGRDYRWYGGAYYPERVGYRYANPSWYQVGGRWGYRPGRWYRR